MLDSDELGIMLGYPEVDAEGVFTVWSIGLWEFNILKLTIGSLIFFLSTVESFEILGYQLGSFIDLVIATFVGFTISSVFESIRVFWTNSIECRVS